VQIINTRKKDRNIILAHTYEYRLPPPPLSSSHLPNPDDASQQQQTVTLDLTSRYLGLVVVPGEHITKIEVEEFVSQVKNGGSKWLLPLDEYETQRENL
jgi:N-alpha-acetyltransferase 38, NatC auxiliary subunit